mmetsp:Transcript_51430/g.123807  ORF Transcript_51430/g.123807 Transcript_51430/m.123807 type:complete len:229 (-) Transcript_51430:224-910(-)
MQRDASTCHLCHYAMLLGPLLKEHLLHQVCTVMRTAELLATCHIGKCPVLPALHPVGAARHLSDLLDTAQTIQNLIHGVCRQAQGSRPLQEPVLRLPCPLKLLSILLLSEEARAQEVLEDHLWSREVIRNDGILEGNGQAFAQPQAEMPHLHLPYRPVIDSLHVPRLLLCSTELWRPLEHTGDQHSLAQGVIAEFEGHSLAGGYEHSLHSEPAGGGSSEDHLHWKCSC